MPKEFDATPKERAAIHKLCIGMRRDCSCARKGIYCDVWLSAVRNNHGIAGERWRISHNTLTGRMREPDYE